MARRGLVPITVLKTVRDRVPETMEELAPITVRAVDLLAVVLDPILTTVLVKTAAILLAVPATATAPMQIAKAKRPAAMKAIRKPPISLQRATRLPLGRLLRLR